MSKSETREKILRAATEMFSEKGYPVTTTREISERAGVTEITVFRHFGNKETLFSEVLSAQSPLSVLDHDFDDHVRGELRSDLTYFAQHYMQSSLNHIHVIRIGIMEAPRNAEFARIIRLIPKRLEEQLAQYLRSLYTGHRIKPADFKSIAQIFYGALFNHVMLLCTFDDEFEAISNGTDGFIEALVSLVCAALLREETD